MGTRLRGSALLLVVAVVHAGCFAGSTLEMAPSRPLGTVTVASPTHGDRTLAPMFCTSGERQFFLGADFFDSEGVVTRLIFDPAGGARLRIYSGDDPLEEGLLFERKECRRFEFVMDRKGLRINDIYDLRVGIDFDCRTEAGDTAKGSLLAEHCH